MLAAEYAVFSNEVQLFPFVRQVLQFTLMRFEDIATNKYPKGQFLYNVELMPDLSLVN